MPKYEVSFYSRHFTQVEAKDKWEAQDIAEDIAMSGCLDEDVNEGWTNIKVEEV